MASLESPFWIHLGSGSLTKTLTEWVTYSSYTVELIEWTTAVAGKADTCQLSVSFTGTFYGIDEELCIVILIDQVFCIRFFNLLRVNHRNRLYCSKVIVHGHFPPVVMNTDRAKCLWPKSWRHMQCNVHPWYFCPSVMIWSDTSSSPWQLVLTEHSSSLTWPMRMRP